jgi:hypothetical protein
MAFRKFNLALVLLLGLALILAGCGSDGSTNPANPGPGEETLVLDAAQAEEFSTGALSMVNELVNSVPDFAAADFASWNLAKSQSDSVVWDPVQEAYVFNFDGPVLELEPPSSWTMSMDIWLQYRDAQESPLQYPIGATEMELDYSVGMYIHSVDESGVFDMDNELSSNLTVRYLGEGQTYGIQGSGLNTVSVSQITPSGSQSGQISLDWSLDVTAAPEGCPSGTAVVHAQDYTLNAEYDGQGNVSWTLTGPGYQASGSEFVACGGPAS